MNQSIQRFPNRFGTGVIVRLTVLWGIAASITSIGCGTNDWQAATYPASGTVTINGKPAAGVVVELHSTGSAADIRNSRPWAVVQDDGSYTLTTYQRGDGAPEGEYVITLRWPPDVTQPSLADRLSGAYANPDESQWQVTVSEGKNELPPVAVSQVKILPKAQARAPEKAPPGPAMGG